LEDLGFSKIQKMESRKPKRDTLITGQRAPVLYSKAHDNYGKRCIPVGTYGGIKMLGKLPTYPAPTGIPTWKMSLQMMIIF